MVKLNTAVMQCVILWCILLLCLFFLDDRKNLRTSQDAVFVLSHDPHLANWKELDCNLSLIWQSRLILCLINIQHKFSSNVPETKSQFFCFWFFSFFFMDTFKVLESLLSALNSLFLPLITNFSPLPARHFPFFPFRFVNTDLCKRLNYCGISSKGIKGFDCH